MSRYNTHDAIMHMLKVSPEYAESFIKAFLDPCGVRFVTDGLRLYDNTLLQRTYFWKHGVPRHRVERSVVQDHRLCPFHIVDSGKDFAKRSNFQGKYDPDRYLSKAHSTKKGTGIVFVPKRRFHLQELTYANARANPGLAAEIARRARGHSYKNSYPKAERERFLNTSDRIIRDLLDD